MICKNCGEHTISKGTYCHSCGQKSNTHRLTLKHFVMHDIVHGLFHLDRGLPKTLKEIFTRPGGVALDYIQGKRKRYYNFFYLLLIIVGIYIFINSFNTSIPDNIKVDRTSRKIMNFAKDYRKAIIFSLIPILGISSFWVFRKLKFTLLEFCIPAVIAVIGSSVFNILSDSVSLLQVKFGWGTNIVLNTIVWLLELSIFLFPMVTFAQFVKGRYSISGRIWRLFLFYLLSFLIIIMLTVCITVAIGMAMKSSVEILY